MIVITNNGKAILIRQLFNCIHQMKYLIILFFIASPALASDKLTVAPWPKKQSCERCVSITTQGYVVSLKNTIEDPIKAIYSPKGLGLYIELKNKTFSFGTVLDSTLLFVKKELKVNSWIKYHELLATKSNDKKIEQLRRSLEITEAKGYYKFQNTKYTAFFIDLPNAPLGTPSELTIIPKNNSEILKINGKFTKKDVELILSNMGNVNLR